MNFIKRKIRTILSLSMAREMFLYGVANTIGYISSFIAVFFVARYLGPSNLGLYSFVQNYSALYITIVGGADYYYSWSIARAEDKFASIREYIKHKFFLASFLTLIGIILAHVTLPSDVFTLVCIFMAPLFLQSLSAFQLYSLYEKKAKLVSTMQSISATISLLLKLTLIYLGADLKYFIFVAGLDVVMICVLFAVYFMSNSYYRSRLLQINRIKMSHMFIYFKKFNFFKSVSASTIFFWNIKTSILAIFLWQLLLRADQLILAAVSNAFTMGIYAAAVKVAEIPNALAGIIYLTLIGRMTHMLDANTRESKEKVKKIFYFYIFLGSIISVFIFIFAPLVINIIYGEKFLGAENVLRIYALSIPAMYALYYYFSVFGSQNRHKLQIIIFVISVILNIILVLTLTPIFSLIGTAWATVISYTFAALMFYVYSEK